MLDKLERKLGKYAIPNLINYLIGGYIIGYIFSIMEMLFQGYSITSLMTLEPYLIIHNFQFWRIITWVLIPPSVNVFFALIMMFFYWQLGSALERIMGTFRFNVYIFGGILFTIIGSFILFAVYSFLGMPNVSIGWAASTNYINMGIFLVFAALFPEERILLYFIIPLKIKWLAYLDIALLAVDFIIGGWASRVMIIASLLNFWIFFITTRKPSFNPRQKARQNAFYNNYRQGEQQAAKQAYKGPGGARHKCDICGRTDVTNPELEFRYCSKCSGSHEYCNDHLFTHAHIQ
ncbi:MAG: hypothetical protein K6F00_08990 [Lachnospiraceae bacterium]|nr:hypothetical protein [Lachnospiraceae bacterium]